MDIPWLTIWMVLAGAGAMLAILLSVQNWEHRRFARGRIRKPMDGPSGHVAVFAPCKGLDLELEQNLLPLLKQDYPNYEVVFIVESIADPAYAAIQQLLSAHSGVSARIVVAGVARDTGQKVHNLQVATAQLSAATEILAFVDSDARPKANWLRTLVQRLDRRADASTGYRWFIPVDATLPSVFLTSFNGAVAGMFGPGGHHLLWGGSWAIRRDVFDNCNLRDAWQYTLSDDLVAADLLHRHGGHIEFEPGCMLASPLQTDWRQMATFVRRQYIIGKVHARLRWAMGMTANSISMLAFWSSLALLITGLMGVQPMIVQPGLFCAFWYGTAVFRGVMRRDTAVTCLPEHRQAIRRNARLDIWGAPLVGLVHWALMLSSAWGRTITWRGNTYRLGRHGKVKLLHRAAQDSADHCPASAQQRIDAAHGDTKRRGVQATQADDQARRHST